MQRINASDPKLAGHFARVITFKTEYARSLIDDFSTKDKGPHIAISVDMLDTGIDVPEAVNLVLFKLIRSKTKLLADLRPRHAAASQVRLERQAA